MASRIMQAIVLVCDGCGTEVGADGSLRSALDARAFAYSLGWRFVPKIRSNGTAAAGTGGATASDVCPTCLPTFEPQPMGSTHRRRLLDGRLS